MDEPQAIIRTFHYSDITEGQRETFDYAITPSVYEHFLHGFNDYSPIHVDEEYAKSRGFAGRVMHGSLLNGFISHFIGTWFPGRLSLLLTVDVRFSQPSYLGDVIRLETVVRQKLENKKVIVLDATLNNLSQNHLAARGCISVLIMEEP
jgi:3-hydroxybutyryl-CoA dehydratase